MQPTEQTTCPGPPIACSNNGVCTTGVCKCTGVWSGPDCSTNGIDLLLSSFYLLFFPFGLVCFVHF